MLSRLPALIATACLALSGLAAKGAEARAAAAARPNVIVIMTVLHGHTGKRAGANWAVREGDWKLMGRVIDTAAASGERQPFPLFLANLAKDVTERENLMTQHPDIVAHLQSLHDRWLASIPPTGDSIP